MFTLFSILKSELLILFIITGGTKGSDCCLLTMQQAAVGDVCDFGSDNVIMSNRARTCAVGAGVLQALVPLLAEEGSGLVLAAWRALDAVTSTIPKEDQAGHVTAVKEAVASAREKERRKRKGGALRVAGFCDPPKALAPILPIYLQGVLQVRGRQGAKAACFIDRVVGTQQAGTILQSSEGR
jgi:hypothetical protein